MRVAVGAEGSIPMNLTGLMLCVAAIAVLSYAAVTWYDCAHDESCHYAKCGARRLCGLARKHDAPALP